MSHLRAASIGRLTPEQVMRWALRCQQHSAEDPSQTAEWWAAELGLCGQNLELVCEAIRDLPAVPPAASPAGEAGADPATTPASPPPAVVRRSLGGPR